MATYEALHLTRSLDKAQRNPELKSGLTLDSKAIIVLSYIGDRVKGQTIVRAQLNGMATQPGETIEVMAIVQS